MNGVGLEMIGGRRHDEGMGGRKRREKIAKKGGRGAGKGSTSNSGIFSLFGVLASWESAGVYRRGNVKGQQLKLFLKGGGYFWGLL